MGNRNVFLSATDVSSKMLINLPVRDTPQPQQRSQADILLHYLSRCLLYVGRYFNAFALELSQALFRVLQVLLAPCARAPLIVADAGEVLSWSVSDGEMGTDSVVGNLQMLTLQAGLQSGP